MNPDDEPQQGDGDEIADSVPRNMGEIQPREISFERRLELQRLATRIAADLVGTTTARERCLIRSMVETLVGRH